MEIEVRETKPRRTVCLLHKGPYYMIGQTFGAFDAWVEKHNPPSGEWVAIYYLDPCTTPPEDLRSHAGVFVPDDYTTDSTEVDVVDLPGGSYAVATHHGPYDGLSNSWGEFVGKGIPSKGLTFRAGPNFEVYVNDCMKVKPAELRTEMWAPIEN